MRILEYGDIDDILLGATVLGCGGGGDPAEGRRSMKRAYDQGQTVTLAAPDELSGDALVGCPYGVGGLTRGSEEELAGLPHTDEHPVVLAVQALSQHLGRAFDALITGELGGASVADALYPAAVLGLPVVDADPVGRAVPELEQSMFYLAGLPLAPQAAVNEIGDTALITKIGNDQRAEAFARALAVASRNQIWVVDHALLWRQMREVVIQGAISRLRALGPPCVRPEKPEPMVRRQLPWLAAAGWPSVGPSRRASGRTSRDSPSARPHLRALVTTAVPSTASGSRTRILSLGAMASSTLRVQT